MTQIQQIDSKLSFLGSFNITLITNQYFYYFKLDTHPLKRLNLSWLSFAHNALDFYDRSSF